MKTNRTILISAIVLALVITGGILLQRLLVDKPALNPGLNPAQKKEILVYFSKMKGSETVTDPVKRPMPASKAKEDILAYAVGELLKGPTDEEKDAGYFSEIPPETKLLSVEETKDGLRVNLSTEFTSGGGSNSMLLRLEEVTKTVASLPQSQPVYLDVEGKQLEILGGEGIMVKEPITASPGVQQ